MSNYPAKPDQRFEYADGYCSVFPRGLEKQFKSGKGHIVLEDDYIVVVNNETPKEIEQKFLKEYAVYYSETKNNDIYIDI